MTTFLPFSDDTSQSPVLTWQMQYANINEFLKSVLGIPTEDGTTNYTDQIPHSTDVTRGGMLITDEAFPHLGEELQAKCISLEEAQNQGWFPESTQRAVNANH